VGITLNGDSIKAIALAGFFSFCQSLSPIRVDEDLSSKIARASEAGRISTALPAFPSLCRCTPSGLCYPLAILPLRESREFQDALEVG
jgi:hypothetical protein